MKKNVDNVGHLKSDWRTSGKSKRRDFHLAIDVPLYSELVEDVIDGIENDVLCVFHPDDERAFVDLFDQDGARLLNTGATLRISIREWLCVGCQAVEMGTSEETDCLAYYTSNGHEAMFPCNGNVPLGPAAFTGKIVLTDRCLSKDNSDTAFDSFRFVIAHELVHVFDTMRFVVPAFMDWRQFWRKVLGEGSRCDLACGSLEDKRLFLDKYGSPSEMAMVAEFWPSQAKRWFDAFRNRKSRANKSKKSNEKPGLDAP